MPLPLKTLWYSPPSRSSTARRARSWRRRIWRRTSRGSMLPRLEQGGEVVDGQLGAPGLADHEDAGVVAEGPGVETARPAVPCDALCPRRHVPDTDRPFPGDPYQGLPVGGEA